MPASSTAGPRRSSSHRSTSGSTTASPRRMAMRSRIAVPRCSHRSMRSTLWRRSQSWSAQRERRRCGCKSATTGHVVAARAPCSAAASRELPVELGLLAPRKPTLRGEQPCIAPVRDDDLDLTLRVPAAPRHDPELEEEQLDVLRELLAVGRVGDLDRVARQERRRAVAGEQGLEEARLTLRGPQPRPLGDPLSALLRAGAARPSALPEELVEFVHVELVESGRRGDRAPETHSADPDHCVVGRRERREELAVDVVEAGAAFGDRSPPRRMRRAASASLRALVGQFAVSSRCGSATARPDRPGRISSRSFHSSSGHAGHVNEAEHRVVVCPRELVTLARANAERRVIA